MSKCSKIYYCIVSRCNNEISYENHRSGQSRCETCAGKIHSKRQRGKIILSLVNIILKKRKKKWDKKQN